MPLPRDSLYGRLAVELGYISREQLEEALKNQRAMREGMGIDQPLEPILKGKGLLTDDQAQDLARAAAIETGEAKVIAGYEIIGRLGQGAMGAVFKARKIDTGRFVALKVLPPSLADERTVARFERESAIVKELDHDNIVSCVEFGYDPEINCHFCALELVEGEDLYKKLTREGMLAEEDAVSIASQIAMALQHAHFNGLVHRDVKPENIMVTPDGTAKLMDLGLARYEGSELPNVTQAGVFVGSPYYASVEQAKGSHHIDVRSDIYSLGATLYHMVTGKPPFEGSTVIEVLGKHIKEKLPWPADVNGEISDGLCRIIAKMMAKDPAKRYPEPNDLLDALDLLEEGAEPAVEEGVLGSSTVAKARKPRLEHKRARRKRTKSDLRARAQRRERERRRQERKSPLPERKAAPERKAGSPEPETEPDKGKRDAGRAAARAPEGALATLAARPKALMAAGAGLAVVAGVVVAATLASRRGRARRPVVPLVAQGEFLSGADRALGRGYRLFKGPMKWFDAFQFCQGAGGHLATATSAEENAHVTALAREGGGPAWIGFTDEREVGEWVWVTGETSAFAAWAEDQPDDGGRLASWAAVAPVTGEWYALGGQDKLAFICEWEAVAAGPGLMGQYFKGGAFDELLTQRIDPRVDIALDRADELWVRWTGFLLVAVEGSYIFRAVGGGGVRLRVGDANVIDRWTDADDEEVGTVDLKPGRVALSLEWAKGRGPGAKALSWGGPEIPISVIPAKSLCTPTSGAGAE